MEYNIIYNNLIETRQHNLKKQGKGFEIHHIVPKSLGGDNTQSNTVGLTAKEHWLAHRLLHRIHTGTAKHKMASALIRMSTRKNRERYDVPSRFYVIRAELNRQQALNSWQDPVYVAKQKAVRDDPFKRAEKLRKWRVTMAKKKAEGWSKSQTVSTPYKRRTPEEKVAKLLAKYKAKGIDPTHYRHRRYINSLKKQS